MATPTDRTLRSAFLAMSGETFTETLLEWPPDVFACTDVLLARADAFRFALSPVEQWPPARIPQWEQRVVEAAQEWAASTDTGRRAVPQLLAEEWAAIEERADRPLGDLAEGRDWRLCEALLTVHAIADEACAGLGVALDTFDGEATVYRARGRELLAHRGSIARLDPAMLRVLPKVRTPPNGRAAFSRYACVHGPGPGVRWHKVPARHPGTDLSAEYVRILLLPWPLRIRTSDFQAVEGSIRRQGLEPYGFFEFAPQEPLDLELLDRVLVAARDEAGSVDVVYLPESAVHAAEISALEELLGQHGVIFLQTGVRGPARESSRYATNYIHMGVNATLEKGVAPPGRARAPWFHYEQQKHHRWSLDQSQIAQYHLGGVLHPHVRWWEAMEVPRQTVQIVEVAELALVCVVCEDLAQNDDAAALVRSVAPTIVFPALLDGPQLSSRWAARYASVLADDPGCAVLSLTSYGMVQRSRPHGHDISSVVALWKDPVTGVREIPLEAGAHAVLLTVCMDRASRRVADGRTPVRNGTQCFDAAIHQVRAADTGSGFAASASAKPEPDLLDREELTVLTGWAEAVAETLTYSPERIARVLAAARPHATWRAALQLPEPSAQLARAIDVLASIVDAASAEDGVLGVDTALRVAGRAASTGDPLEALVRRVLAAMIQERRTRQPQ